jgi:fumarate hydratase class I
MRNLKANLLELIRRTSAELPDDVFRAVDVGAKSEPAGTTGAYAMDIITKNIDLAKRKSQPLCQDTGSILFFVKVPLGFDQMAFEAAAKAAVGEATAQGYLRQNSVDSVTGKNSGNNLGPGSPTIHFHQYRGTRLEVRLVLKGGGCENVGAQYSLPDTRIGANRDLDGVRKVILDAVVQAQGKGCSPGILGVCVGGDRATGYLHSKEQLLRTLDDVSPDPPLAALERDIVETANKLGIGPMGFGGKTTLLGCKIGALNRLPASFFVSISYMCWAYRRQGVLLNGEGKIVKWLY